MKIEAGVAKRQGAREHMEDEYLIVDRYSKKVIDSAGEAETMIPEEGVAHSYALFAVFDGHGSDQYSFHAKKHMSQILEEDLEFRGKNYPQALLNAFAKENAKMKQDLFDPKLEQVLQKEVNTGKLDPPKNEGEKAELASRLAWQVGGGTTATVALIVEGNLLLVANAGDSRAVLGMKTTGRAGQQGCHSIRISKDHHTDDAKEKSRVEGAGGTIRGNRVRGEGHAINMTRALGDFEFKAPLNQADADFITWVPTLTLVELTPANEFMVLASDGLWGEFEDEEVIDYVSKALGAGMSAEDICLKLTKESTRPLNSDNTTVIVVVFQWSQEDTEHYRNTPRIEKNDIV